MSPTPALASGASVALVGGNEFRRDCDHMDRALIERLAGPAAQTDARFGMGRIASWAGVAILPTAATNENPYVAGESGARHFRRLGVRAEKLMIVDTDSANDAGLVGLLEDFAGLYFTGGDPIYLRDTLLGSKAWEAVKDVAARGGLIAGSSAGAMVLGEQLWRFDGWTAGLGLAPGLAVLPHHATLAARWNGPAMAAALPAGVTLVGIDEATALLLPERIVLGVGQVTVYGPAGPVTYAPGATVEA
jgi:cyanophycinase